MRGADDGSRPLRIKIIFLIYGLWRLWGSDGRHEAWSAIAVYRKTTHHSTAHSKTSQKQKLVFSNKQGANEIRFGIF